MVSGFDNANDHVISEDFVTLLWKLWCKAKTMYFTRFCGLQKPGCMCIPHRKGGFQLLQPLVSWPSLGPNTDMLSNAIRTASPPSDSPPILEQTWNRGMCSNQPFLSNSWRQCRPCAACQQNYVRVRACRVIVWLCACVRVTACILQCGFLGCDNSQTMYFIMLFCVPCDNGPKPCILQGSCGLLKAKTYVRMATIMPKRMYVCKRTVTVRRRTQRIVQRFTYVRYVQNVRIVCRYVGTPSVCTYVRMYVCTYCLLAMILYVPMYVCDVCTYATYYVGSRLFLRLG